MPDIVQQKGSCSCSQYSHEWRRSKSFSSLTDVGSPAAHQGCGGFGCNLRRSFSYYRLPPQLLRLSVLKLDGSSFYVQVARTACVSELKQAVEEVFSLSPKEGEGKISWSHVWGHFCLCYRSYKLVDDKASLQDFEIKDGDQLRFIRHLSIIHNLPRKTRSRNLSAAHEQNMMQSSREAEVGKGEDGYHKNVDEDEEREYMMGGTEFKLAHFLKGWLSYSRLWIVGHVRADGKHWPSRFVRHHNCSRDAPHTREFFINS